MAKFVTLRSYLFSSSVLLSQCPGPLLHPRTGIPELRDSVRGSSPEMSTKTQCIVNQKSLFQPPRTRSQHVAPSVKNSGI